MRSAYRHVFIAALAATFMPAGAYGETPEEWVKLGTRVHGGFGTFIPVGIRIGLDALRRLEARPREVTVTYHNGPKAPCPCIADGVMIATAASPGQGTLQIASEAAPPDLLGSVIIRSKKTGAALRYTVSDEWRSKLLDWNRAYDPMGRYDVVMKAENLFNVTPVQGQ
jgi:hypothetical protein